MCKIFDKPLLSGRKNVGKFRPYSHCLPGLTRRVGGKTDDHVPSCQFPDFMKRQIILSYVHAVGLH